MFSWVMDAIFIRVTSVKRVAILVAEEFRLFSCLEEVISKEVSILEPTCNVIRNKKLLEEQKL